MGEDAWANSNWKDFQQWVTTHFPVAVPAIGLFSTEGDILDFAAQQFLHPCCIMDNGIRIGERRAHAEFLDSWERLMVDPARQRTGLEGLAALAADDPMAASAWLNQRPTAPWRDQAAGVLARQIVLHDPEGAFVWAKSIKDKPARGEIYKACWEAWRKLEPREADAYVKEHAPEVLN